VNLIFALRPGCYDINLFHSLSASFAYWTSSIGVLPSGAFHDCDYLLQLHANYLCGSGKRAGREFVRDWNLDLAEMRDVKPRLSTSYWRI
jgi:hypothetical protein